MPSDSKALILQAIDIVELIGRTVALRRAGKDFVGLCPFHQEKTASFHVSPSKAFFYCFGCKASGNAIDFVMKRDRIEFKEALQQLADQAGIELPRYGGRGEDKGLRQKVLDANSAACRYFEGLLADPDRGAAAREYLAKRGFEPDWIKKFQIGLAADAWDGLLAALGRKIGPETLVAAGLIKQRQEGGGHYDTFRNRVMFPIRNESGQVIAFGGRVMPGSTDPAKYLNSPETMLFSKGRCFFALDLARQRIVERRTVAVVEGYTDAVMAHQFGVSNVVSVLGTAMTEQHVAVLRRFADRIVLLFDADSAGDAAVNRVVQLFLTQPVEIAVATMPQGMDPDEYLLKHGAQSFDLMLAEAADALTYAWKRLSRTYRSGEADLTGQQKAVSEYLELLGSARGAGPVDSLRWGQAVARVSRLTDIPVAQLHQRFASKRNVRPTLSAVSASSDPSPAETRAIITRKNPDAQDRAERWILGVLLSQPSLWGSVQAQVGVVDFVVAGHRRLAEVYWQHQRDEGEPVFSELLSSLADEDLKQLAVELLQEAEQLADLSATLDSALKHLGDVRRKREEQQIVAQLRRGEENEQAQDLLLRQLMDKARQPDLRRTGQG